MHWLKTTPLLANNPRRMPDFLRFWRPSYPVLLPPFIAAFFSLCLILFLGLAASSAVAQSDTIDMLGIETATLNNGMEIIVIPDRRSQVVTHMLWYRVGGVDDPEGKSGLAHFFEHLMFRGTQAIGKGEFVLNVRRRGGQLNASTAADYTNYFERIALDQLPDMMRMEADRMQNLIINPELVALERDVILEERSFRVDGRPESLLREQMVTRLHQDGAYRAPIIGWRRDIEQYNAADAEAFYRRYYAPDNAILTIVGNTSMAEILPLAHTYYGPLKAANRPRTRFDDVTDLPVAGFDEPIIFADKRTQQQAWKRIYRLPAYHTIANKKRFAALDIASEILGGGTPSRLHQKLVVEVGQANAANSYALTERLHEGEFHLSISLAPDADFDDIAQHVDAEISKLANTPPTEEELERAKTQLIASALFARDSQYYMALIFGSSAVLDIAPEEVLGWQALVEQVTAEDVQRAVASFLKPQHSLTGHLTRAGGDDE